MNSFPIFPIPVVGAGTGTGIGIGPGSQQDDGELDYMVMPQGMQTYAVPILPEPEEVATLTAAHAVLQQILLALGEVAATAGQASQSVDLSRLGSAELQLVNQILGEGEVSARVEVAGEGKGKDKGTGGTSIRIQESIFAGVWRTVVAEGAQIVADRVDIGTVPQVLVEAARCGAQLAPGAPLELPATLPPGVMNAPSILAELNAYLAQWQAGTPAQVINLTLLPLSEQDVAFLEQELEGGSVLILSRGYGNCRILSTRVPNCWRVVYYNSSDSLLLNTVEVTDIPEVACAAAEDLVDSHERLREVLDWVIAS